MKFYCNIQSYGLTALEATVNHASYIDQQKYTYPKTNNIPMMQARRMSTATKLACELYLEISKKTTFDYALFLSAHGEIERSFKIIKNILQKKEVSPTDFSMSVHNTASGISSIISQNRCETTSIAGGPDGFISVFHEIIAVLLSGKKRIILIAYDGEMPIFYQKHDASDQQAYAVALIIEQGQNFTLSLNSNSKKEPTIATPNLPLPLQFWQKWQKKETHSTETIEIKGTNQTLLLQKVL